MDLTFVLCGNLEEHCTMDSFKKVGKMGMEFKQIFRKKVVNAYGEVLSKMGKKLGIFN